MCEPPRHFLLELDLAQVKLPSHASEAAGTPLAVSFGWIFRRTGFEMPKEIVEHSFKSFASCLVSVRAITFVMRT